MNVGPLIAGKHLNDVQYLGESFTVTQTSWCMQGHVALWGGCQLTFGEIVCVCVGVLAPLLLHNHLPVSHAHTHLLHGAITGAKSV